MPIHVFESVGSTNDTAKMLAESGEIPALVVAKSQTSGRGRFGRVFFSPKHTGAYFSVVVRPSSAVPLSLVTPAAAVAVASAIERVAGRCASIKWVNDVYVDGKKACGILCECAFDGLGNLRYAVVGIGINVTTRRFPKDIRGRAGSVTDKSGVVCELIAEVVDRLVALVSVPQASGFIDEYRARCFLLGQTVLVSGADGDYTARAIAVDDLGGLIVRTETGEQKVLNSEEVSVKIV